MLGGLSSSAAQQRTSCHHFINSMMAFSHHSHLTRDRFFWQKVSHLRVFGNRKRFTQFQA